jgi:hypothetical protein
VARPRLRCAVPGLFIFPLAEQRLRFGTPSCISRSGTPRRGHGPALDIPARLAYLPSFTIILDLGTFIGRGIPMKRDELVGSVVLGAMAALISMLVWGRSLVDLIAAGT